MINWTLIGCGNMAQAIFRGMGAAPAGVSDHFYNRSSAKAQALATQVNGKAHTSFESLPLNNIVMLGFKPQQLAEVSAWLAPKITSNLNPDTIIISMLAAVDSQLLQQFLGCKKIIRLMPNLPVAFRKGATTYWTNVPEKELAPILKRLSLTGLMLRLEEESLIDRATPYHGSGPALYYWLLEKMSADLVVQGMAPAEARALVVATINGAAIAASQSSEDFKTMREKVTSKAGLTFEMIAELEESNLETMLRKAMARAQTRGAELARQIKQQLQQ